MKKQEQTLPLQNEDIPPRTELFPPATQRHAVVVGGCLLFGLVVLFVVLLWFPPATKHPHDPRVRLQVVSSLSMKVGEFRSPVIRMWKQSLWRKSWEERGFVMRRYRILMTECTPPSGLSWKTWGWMAHRPGIYRVILHVKSLPWLSLHQVDQSLSIVVKVSAKIP